MSRRSGQKGSVVPVGNMWHGRYWLDVTGQEKRIRPSVPLGPRIGPNKITKSEAERRIALIIDALGINTPEFFERVTSPVQTFAQKVEWVKQNDPAFLEGSPGWIETMESALKLHILPYFGSLPLATVTEEKVQEFITRLKMQWFERRRKNGTLIKRYRLRRKTIREIIGIIKKVVGKKTWISWELKLGRPEEVEQRFFTEKQMQDIVKEAEPGMWKLFWSMLASTGIRIGENCGLKVEDLRLDERPFCVRVERTFSERTGAMRAPKTKKGYRDIDIDPEFAGELREYLAGRKSGLVFHSRNGTPLRPGNVLKRQLHPILKNLGIPLLGKLNHAFRRGRVTVLRKNKVPGDLQKLWIGHSSLEMTDRYSHTDQELEYRQRHVVPFRVQ